MRLCGQQRHKQAFAYAQSDQRICCRSSLPREYHQPSFQIALCLTNKAKLACVAEQAGLRSWARGYKTFFMLNSLAFLTFISRINDWLWLFKHKDSIDFGFSDINEYSKSNAHLSSA